MKGICPVCDDYIREPGLSIHPDCALAQFMIVEPIDILSSGDVDKEVWLSEFVPEVNFVFIEDWRTRRVFKLAEDIITRSAFYTGGDFPVADLEIEITPKTRDMFRVLSLARLAYLDGDTVRLGPLGVQVCQLLPTGEPWDSPTVRIALEQIYGWICLAVSHAFLEAWLKGERSIGRPRKILKVFQWLANVANDYPDRIPDEIEANQLFYERIDRFGLSERDRKQIAKALLGIGVRGRSPKLFRSHRGTAGELLFFRFKPQTLFFLERIRERYRERVRGR